MSNLRYTDDHEWIEIDADGVATVGITDHAQDALGDIVFIELPPVGKAFAKGDAACVVESVKAAADVKMPVAGVVAEVNGAIVDDPAAVNKDPMGVGWFLRIRPDNAKDLDSLMDGAAYQALLARS
jgi:glycine cleavage system H protein